jgi:hypothetical protein
MGGGFRIIMSEFLKKFFYRASMTLAILSIIIVILAVILFFS